MRLRATAVLVVLLAVFSSPASTSEGVGAAYVLANGTGVERNAIIDPVAEGIRQCAASSECLGRMVGTVEVGIAARGVGRSKLLNNLTKPGRSRPGVAGTVDDVAESAVAARGSGTAIRRVGDLLESVDDVLTNPRLLGNLNPADLQLRLGGRIPSGWRVEALGRGSHQGQGFVLRQYTPRGHPTGRQLRWHPGGGHHGPDPYWRVLDGTTKSDIIPAAPWPR